MFLKDQHRPQSDGPLPTPTDIDTKALRSLQEIVPPRAVPSKEGAFALATQIVDLTRISRCQPLQSRVQVFAGLRRVLDKIEPLDLMYDGAEQDRPCRIAHPSVELSIRLVRPQRRISKVETRGLRFLRKRDHVWRLGHIPVLVRPEFACGPNTSLHLIHNKHDIVALRDLAKTSEEDRRGVIIASLGLYGLDHNGRDGAVEVLD